MAITHFLRLFATPDTMAKITKQTFETLLPPSFANAEAINRFFMAIDGRDFIDWFNTHLAGKGVFASRRIAPAPTETLAAVKAEFKAFWDNLPVVFNRPEISLFDFTALMCIAINETNGRFRSRTEICGKGRTDENGAHEGLAYAFDRILRVKKSYNLLAGNRTAFECFTDPVFCKAHRGLGLADRLSGDTNPASISESWKGDTYPVDFFPVVEDLALTGFAMQADFYKFRGRGAIQITGRPPYRSIAQHLQRYTGTNPTLLVFKNRWANLTPDEACTISRDIDWDLIFAQPEIVSRSLRIYSNLASPSRNLFVMDKDLNRLNAMTTGVGSYFHTGRTISGSAEYALEKYFPRVLVMLETMAAHLRD